MYHFYDHHTQNKHTVIRHTHVHIPLRFLLNDPLRQLPSWRRRAWFLCCCRCRLGDRKASSWSEALAEAKGRSLRAQSLHTHLFLRQQADPVLRRVPTAPVRIEGTLFPHLVLGALTKSALTHGRHLFRGRSVSVRRAERRPPVCCDARRGFVVSGYTKSSAKNFQV